MTVGLSGSGWTVSSRPGLAPAEVGFLPEPVSCPLLLLAEASACRFVELVIAWRSGGIRRPILAITGGGAAEELALLKAGADDWLPLIHDLGRLDARLHALMRRAIRQGEVITAGPIALDPTTRVATVHGEDCRLGQRQFSLLWLLAERQGEVVRAADILAAWRLSARHENLVEVQVSQVRKKLGPGSAHLTTVRGLGYSLVVGCATGPTAQARR